ncbi:MAG: pyruvate dehydrogenase (acetyl-transferring) E1 component subunit alpha, partial [Planctomycetes bacterium]|nr:pyruvate dehydrogenase (acetyl-transferring) E1 component subunit alpha [Planctomycetota bacterium]
VESWFKKEPIIIFEQFLVNNQIFKKEGLEKIKEELAKEVNDAHTFARESSCPEKGELIRYVYKE